jgi:ABC-2 type transport system ATP-binding protein
VQLAASLVHSPDLLVLDEPFSGLDPLGVESLEQVLRREAERGAAIVFSSHQLDVVQSMCDDVVVIDGGREVLSGTLTGLRRASGQRQVEVGFTDHVTWHAGGVLVAADVLESSPGRTRLLVPAATRPEDVMAEARRAGEVSHFTFEPPPLSQLFRQAVRP